MLSPQFVLRLLTLLTLYRKALLSLSKNDSPVIVSILDSTSTLSCLLKIYSIIQSSRKSSLLKFKFLIVETGNGKLSASSWNNAMSIIFPTLNYETKDWNVTSNNIEDYLRGDHFEKAVVFARFYLPDIFSDVEKFIYLDNDIIVTMDIAEIYYDSLDRKCDFSAIGETDRHRGDHTHPPNKKQTAKFRRVLYNSKNTSANSRPAAHRSSSKIACLALLFK